MVFFHVAGVLQVRPGHVILPIQRTFRDHIDICNKLHGSVSLVRDLETQNALIEDIKGYPSCTATGGQINWPDFLK